MKRSKLIALSAIAAAFAVIFLALGAFVPVFDYSGIFIASVCMTLPLAKKSVWAGVMAYLAAALLSLVFVGGRFEITVSFAVFFGLHPIVNLLFDKIKLNRIIGLIIKDIWFIGSLLLLYFFFRDFVGFETEVLQKYALPILIIGGGLLFIIYDIMMVRFQRFADMAVERLKL